MLPIFTYYERGTMMRHLQERRIHMRETDKTRHPRGTIVDR